MVRAPDPVLAIPLHPHARRAWIRYQFDLRGISLAQLARELGVTRNAVYIALRSPYPRMEAAIAEALDMRAEDLWPERYTYRAEKARRAEARRAEARRAEARRAEARKREREKSRKADGGHGATITAGRRRRKSARAAEGAEGRPES